MINIGDKVEFTGKRGVVRGTVTDIKSSSPGKRKLAAFGLTAPAHKVLMVMPEDGGGIWHVPETMCKKLGAGDRTAKARASELISKIKQQRQARVSSRFDAAMSLDDLKKGDPIEVKFRDAGWVGSVFSHMSAGNRVAFTDPRSGRVRFTSPQFVRRPAKD